LASHEHHHHRSRIRRRFLASDPRSLDDYQLFELLLCYTIPRQDTNPIAHRLLKRFGNVRGVLNASKEDLLTIDGIGPRSVELILAVSDYVRRCFEPNETEHTLTLHFYDDFLQNIRREMNAREEGLWVFNLDARWRLIDKVHCREELVDCLQAMISGHGVRVLLVWNHHRYTTEPFPSAKERSFTRMLYEKCIDLGISVELCARIAGPITEYQTVYSWRQPK